MIRSDRWLQLLLALFFILGLTYALTTPPFEASDELWHYPMVRHLADGNSLPVQATDPAEAGPWRQEASQPPLYYYLGALLTFPVDTSDMAAVRQLNPHVDIGVLTPDGNRNLALHDPDANPWQGTLLAVYIVRLASVVMGLATVYLTYRLALPVFGDRPELAVATAAIVAFLPMFLFISGAVNNDNLAIPLISLALLQMVELVASARAGAAIGKRGYLLLGVIIGLAALTKISGVLLLALALGTVYVVAWIAADRPGSIAELLRLARPALIAYGQILLPTLLIAGWWYWRNIQLYGDWTGWSAFIAVLGQRAHPATLAQLWDERWGFMSSFWGLFGGVNVAMSDWIYQLLNGILVLAVITFPIFLWQRLRAWWPRRPGTWLTWPLHFAEAHFALIVCLLWSLATVAGLINWATTTWSSQGRLVFYALPSLAILLVAGLVGWWPGRRPAALALAGVGGFLFTVAALAPFLWIRPVYAASTGCSTAPTHVVNVDFGDQLRLLGYDLETASTSAGAVYPVTLYWQVLAPMDANWSVFVHLNDPVLGGPVAQRDMYLGQGLLATSWLAPGDCLVNAYHLAVPATAVAPATLDLTVGLYQFESGERLPLTAVVGEDSTGAAITATPGQDAATIAVVDLTAANGPYPNPSSLNLGDRFELVGFELAPRRAEAGATFDLTLYWRPLVAPDKNYTFFAQVLGDFGGANTRWAASDLAPPGGTLSWAPGAVQAVHLPLVVDPTTPGGIYPVYIGVYAQDEAGAFNRLPVVSLEGRVTNEDLWLLTPVRIDE